MKLFKFQKTTLLFLSSLITLQSCGGGNELGNDIDIPEMISISEIGLYPEGIDYNTITDEFLVGSIARSEVGIVDPETGTYTPFVSDPGLASVTGVHTDEERNRLLAVSGNLGFSANSDSNPSSLAYLGIYDLETGEIVRGFSLQELLEEGSAAFANDIATDTDGNIYITDSFSPVIYKVDSNTFEASIFIDGADDFSADPGQFGLNGIVFIGDSLVVCKLDDGALFRIPLDNPEDFIRIDAPAFVGADGLEVDQNGDIVLVENSFGVNPGTHVLTSSDGWQSASISSSFTVEADKFPTTAALASDGNTYVLNAYLSLALSGDLSQETFTILRTE